MLFENVGQRLMSACVPRRVRADLEQIQLILAFVGTPPPEDRAWIRSEKVRLLYTLFSHSHSRNYYRVPAR